MTFTILDTRMTREPSGHTRKEVLARCACGDTAWRSAGNIASGRSTQCKACAARTHGHSESPEYAAWASMVQRCTNPRHAAYKDYGGRGITVCRRWMKLENFLADMGKRPAGHTLERKNNERGYSPSNCVWATQAEQNANRRNTVLLTAFGRTQHVAAWCRELGLRQDTVSYRLKHGYTAEQALRPVEVRA